MRKNFLVAAAFFVLSVSPTFAIYQVDDESTSTEESTVAEPTTAKTTREFTTSDKKMMLMTASDEVKTTRAEAKDSMKEERIAAREEFKTKMSAIKDARKQKALTNLDSRITEFNKKKTTQMGEKLNRYSEILTKLSTKEATLKADGKNTTILVADIATATTAIDAAKVAVAEQSAKDYVVEVTTEEALKTGASATIKEFMTDIKAVHALVVTAQKAVVKAWKSAALLEAKITLTPSPVEDTTTP